MQEDINLIIEDFKNNIINTINGSQLPPAIVYYIFKDINKDVEASYRNYIQQAQQRQAAAASQQEAAVPADEEKEEQVKD